MRRQFASDNYSGICPEAWAALEAANTGHTSAYGNDEYTRDACNAIRELFNRNCDVFFVFNGTAANSLALAALCQSYHSIVCHDQAHVETDECGAPEFFSHGTKILLAPGANGKIDPEAIDHLVTRRCDIHYPKPKVVSISQATELGTVYTPDELSAVGESVKRNGLRFHVDGARFANAVAALKVKPEDLSWRVGVDVLCFGGTKNGMAVGEAIIFFDSALSAEFEYRCKQSGQLASKMRFLSAPWSSMLLSGAWLKNAERANRAAEMLERELSRIPQIKIMFPRQANSIFVDIPPAAAENLRARGWIFYDFIALGHARLMCSWDTTESDIQDFTQDLISALARTS